MRDELDTEYFLDVHELQWAGGIGTPAGIWWIDGKTVMAAHSSRAEQRLVALGAIQVASLIFDPDPREGNCPGHVVERVSPDSLALPEPSAS